MGRPLQEMRDGGFHLAVSGLLEYRVLLLEVDIGRQDRTLVSSTPPFEVTHQTRDGVIFTNF